MNKYKQALNNIMEGGSYEDLQCEFELMEELIDSYEMIKVYASAIMSDIKKVEEDG